VYPGGARPGKYVNPQAHEPIVTQAEFDAAQAQRTMQESTGERYPVYYCVGRYAKGNSGLTRAARSRAMVDRREDAGANRTSRPIWRCLGPFRVPWGALSLRVLTDERG
jgi:hypothetical protein